MSVYVKKVHHVSTRLYTLLSQRMPKLGSATVTSDVTTQ